MEVFEDDQDRLLPAFPNEEPLDGVQGAPASLLRVEGQPLRVVGRDVEEGQERR